MRGKLWCFVVGVFAALCMVNAQNVYANDTQATVYSENSIFYDEDEAVDYINEGIMSQAEMIEITISEEMYSGTTATVKFEQILDSVAMYYETSGGSYSYYKVSGGTKFEIYFHYKITAEENKAYEQVLYEVLDSLDLDGKTEYQKVRAIHDYICDSVDYDTTYSKYTAYDALMTGSAVCQGFANLFFRMCYESDLDCELITGIGNGGGHAWNIVRIGDVYYDIDVTWDGQDEYTRHTYFLNCEKDFDDHTRNDRFNTDEFHAKYPMAGSSWMDFSDITVRESVVDNIGTVYFSTIDGGTVSNIAENNRPKILLFGSTSGCTYTSTTFTNLAGSEFSDVDIVMIDANYADLDTVQSFKTEYGKGNGNIKYSYSTGYNNLSVMWDYVEALGLELTYFPLVVYIDSDNKVQYSDYSSSFSTGYMRNIVDTYLYHNPLSDISANKVTVYAKESTRLSVKVYGIERNQQFVTWSSSDTSVATVDENGVIKGIKQGTAVITCKINDTISHTCQVTVNREKIADGFNLGYDGVWAYYKNGVVDTSYTGLAKNPYGCWYVKNGLVDASYTGAVKNAYGIWYIKKGKLDLTYTGIAAYGDLCIYMKEGKYDSTYTGLAKNAYGIWYIKKGILDTTYTGTVKNAYGIWYIKKGKLDTTYTGMAIYESKWIYIKAGAFDSTYTGIAKNSEGIWYMKNGILDNTYTGLAKNAYGIWYMKDGKLDTTYTGLVKNAYGVWYIKNGKLDTTYTGLVTNAYGTWYIKNGKFDSSYSGKFTFNGKTYTIKNGQVV